MNETRTLTEFLVQSTFDKLPKETVDLAKLCLLDTLGVGLFASRTEWARIVAKVVRQERGEPESTVWGTKDRGPAARAALANGTAAHGFELDDMHLQAHLHPGAVVVPAAVAVAEAVHADGKKLLAAVVLGYEVMGRVGKAVCGQLHRGFHPTGCNGVFGAATAAGYILGLNSKQMLNAFGIAGCFASGLLEFSQDPEGTMVKRLYGGRPAESGVTAALLAQEGYTGPATILEGRYGYCNLYAGVDGPRISELTNGLGQSYQIFERSVKPYAACGALHSALDAVGEFKSEYHVPVGAIRRVTLGVNQFILNQHAEQEPVSMMAAQYSMPFTAAWGLVRNQNDPREWDDAALRDPTIRRLAKAIELVHDKEIEEAYTRDQQAVKVKIDLQDGRRFETKVLDAKGSLGNPVTPQEVREKFRTVAPTVLAKEKVAALEKLVDSLEQVDDARRLGELLSP